MLCNTTTKNLTMSNKKLTLTEALCIIQSGWGISDVEKRLYFEASELISNEVQRVRLEYQKQLIEEKLQDLKSSNNNQSSVEWLLKQLDEKAVSVTVAGHSQINITIDVPVYMDMRKQAKAMHNEELKEMYLKGIQNYDPTFKK
jgi:hypothetical protein